MGVSFENSSTNICLAMNFDKKYDLQIFSSSQKLGQNSVRIYETPIHKTFEKLKYECQLWNPWLNKS